MQCELCGKELDLVRASVEGTLLNVCNSCSKFGRVLSKRVEQSTIVPRPPKIKEEAPTQVIVSNYAVLVKKARESLGLKQEDFAKKINEKASVIHNIESGRYEPPIELARKLERFLRIKIVEDYKEKSETITKKSEEGFTLGDLIKLD